MFRECEAGMPNIDEEEPILEPLVVASVEHEAHFVQRARGRKSVHCTQIEVHSNADHHEDEQPQSPPP